MITYKKGDDVIIASANVNLNKSLGVILRYSERLDKYEVKLTASLMTKKDITELFDGLGFDKKQRKDYE